MGRKAKASPKQPKNKLRYIEKKLSQGKTVTAEELEWRRNYREELLQKEVDEERYLVVAVSEDAASTKAEESATSTASELPAIDLTTSASTTPVAGTTASPFSATTAGAPSQKKTASSFAATEAQKAARDAAVMALKAQLESELMVGGPDFVGTLWADMVEAANQDNASVGVFAFPQGMMDKIVRPCIRLTALQYIPAVNPEKVAPIGAISSTAIVWWGHRKFRKIENEKAEKENQKADAPKNGHNETPREIQTPPSESASIFAPSSGSET